jgi:hypothetical protein
MRARDMQEEQIRDLLKYAASQLLDKDMSLFMSAVNERSISHRLAVHLIPLFDEYDVDCEYNRCGIIVKTTNHNKKRVFPDIIVHKRNVNNNLVVIEMKKNSSPSSKRADIEKLKDYMNTTSLEYQYAFFVDVRIKKHHVSVDAFQIDKDGEETHVFKVAPPLNVSLNAKVNL